MSTHTTTNNNGTHQQWLPEPQWTEEDLRREDALFNEFVAQIHAGISPGRERPPSHRDLEIFHQHVVRHRKQRDIAAAFEIKQGQISRICAKVRRWLGRATAEQQGLPAGIEGLRSQLRTHEQQTAELLVQATASYQRSTENQVITKIKTRRRASGEEEKWEETITKTQHGSVQLLRFIYNMSRELLTMKTGRVPGCRGPKVLPPDASLVKQRELKRATEKELEQVRYDHQEHMRWHAERSRYVTPDGKPKPLPPHTKDLITVIGIDGVPTVGTRFSNFHRLGRGTVFQVLDPRLHRPYDTDYKPMTAEELAAEEAAEGELNFQNDPNAEDLPKVQPEDYAAILAGLGAEVGDRKSEVGEDVKQEPDAPAHQACSAHQDSEVGDRRSEVGEDMKQQPADNSPADAPAHQACSAHQDSEVGDRRSEVGEDMKQPPATHHSPLTPHHSPDPCSAHQDPNCTPSRGRRRPPLRRAARQAEREARAALTPSATEPREPGGDCKLVD